MNYLFGNVMNMRLRLMILIVMFCVPVLTGCGEVFNEYYISNHTDISLMVRLTPRYIDTVDLSSGSLIEDIQNSARSSLQQPVSFDQDGKTVQFEIPAKTTVFLGFSSGGNDLFSQLEVKSNNQHLVMDSNSYKEYFTVHDSFVGAIVHVFNVK